MIEFAKRTNSNPKELNNVEVSVTCIYYDKKTNKKTLRFSFSEKAIKMICGDNKYALVGVDKTKPNRIYFCQANSQEGYKMTKPNNGSSRYCSVFGNKVSYINPASFVGCYSLQYDAINRALYIDRNNKKQEANN